MARKKRNTEAQVQKIKDEIYDLRYKQGWSNQSIVKHLMETHEYNQSSAYDILKKSREEVAEKTLKEGAMEDALTKMDELYTMAIAQGNLKVALDIQKELDKLLELGVQKMEIEFKGEQPLFTPIIKEEEKKKGDK